jgi:hypothetical protein
LTKDAVKQVQDSEYEAHCKAVSEIQSIDHSKYNQLKDKRAKTSTDRLQFEKADIERRYHVPVTPELVKADANGWHSQLKLHYYLTVGRQHLPAREASSARKQLEEGNGAIFKPDFNKRQIGAKIWLLDAIGFDKLMQLKELRTDSPELLSALHYCQQHPFEFQAATGISISRKVSPMAFGQRIAGLIGYRFPFLRKEGSRGSQVRVYGAAAADFLRDDESKIVLDSQGQAIPLADGRDEVFAAWLDHDAAALVQQEDKGVLGCPENVSNCDTVVRPNKDLDIIASDYRGGVTTVSSDTISSQSELEELVDFLPLAETAEDFSNLVEGTPLEVIQDAILFQEPQRKIQLQGWLDALAVRETAIAAQSPQSDAEPESIKVGQTVWAWIGFFKKWGRGVVSAILPGVSWDVRLEGECLDRVRIYHRAEIEVLAMSG